MRPCRFTDPDTRTIWTKLAEFVGMAATSLNRQSYRYATRPFQQQTQDAQMNRIAVSPFLLAGAMFAALWQGAAAQDPGPRHVERDTAKQGA